MIFDVKGGKMKYIFVLVYFLLAMSVVSADTITSTLSMSSNSAKVTFDKFFIGKELPFEIVANYSNYLNCSIVPTSTSWSLIYENTTQISVGVDIPGLLNESQTKLISCTERATYEQQQKSSCENKYNELLKQNLSDYKEQYNLCQVDLRGKDNDISNKDKTISDLETEKKDTANQKYFWAVGGIVVGILGWRFYKGEIGKGGVKDKSEDEFNRRQAG